MKKILSFVLCIMIAATSCAGLLAVAAQNDGGYNGYPVILVPGYTSTILVNEETGEQQWTPDVDSILKMVLKDAAKLGIDIGALTLGNAKKLADQVGGGIVETCEQLKCNPDGTGRYPLKRMRTTAAELQYSALLEEFPDGEFQYEPEMLADIGAIVGNENVFIFNTDFRMGTEVCAEQLNDFIESVKAFTGKDKVNIFAVSHGGQTTATYITLHGDKNDLAKVVLTIPAIAGAGMAYDIMADTIELDEVNLLKFVEFGTYSETDYNWLVQAQQLGFLDDLCHYLLPYIYEVIEYWGSPWDFITADHYEEIKALHTEEAGSAEFIAIHDRYHYDILPNVGNALREAKANGAEISIIAGYDIGVTTGLQENSDGLITVASSTGATPAPFGQRFADGYTQINDCDGKYKVSPSMTVDASTAYLPDNTWFVSGYYHGMTYFDYYTRNLLYTLLTSDEIKDVYSSPEYPQFHDTTSPSQSVYAEFEGCTPGYIDSNAAALKITNCCWSSNVIVNAVTIDGADLQFSVPTKVLKPGESVTVPFSGKIPEVSKKEVSLNVCYTIGTATPLCYRTQEFTIMNGEDCEYTDGYVALGTTALDSVLSANVISALKKFGLYNFCSMLYNLFRYVYASAVSLLAR